MRGDPDVAATASQPQDVYTMLTIFAESLDAELPHLLLRYFCFDEPARHGLSALPRSSCAED